MRYLIVSLFILFATLAYSAVQCPRPDAVPKCNDPAPVPFCRFTVSDVVTTCIGCHNLGGSIG